MSHPHTQIPDDVVIGEIRQLLDDAADPSIAGWCRRFRHSSAWMKLDRWLPLLEQARGGGQFDMPPQPDDIAPIEDILDRRKTEFARRKTAWDAAFLTAVDIKIDGPFAICHLGDPHLDDPGTDIAGLEHDLKVIRDTPGMIAANVGDVTNNWGGRLARLHGEQTTTVAESWRLAEWFFDQCKWLYFVMGNHDMWSGDGSPLLWIAKARNCTMSKSQVRLNLICPNGVEIRVNARHDFTGHSQWNVVHAPAKAAQLGFKDHILTCGHKHVSGYGVTVDPATGLVSHCLMVEGYKVCDEYAHAKGFPRHHIAPYAVTVIDPAAQHQNSLIQVYHDLELAADFLTWLRKKQKAA